MRYEKKVLYHWGKTSLIMPRLLFSSETHQQCTADLHSAEKPIFERNKNTFSVNDARIN